MIELLSLNERVCGVRLSPCFWTEKECHNTCGKKKNVFASSASKNIFHLQAEIISNRFLPHGKLNIIASDRASCLRPQHEDWPLRGENLSVKWLLAANLVSQLFRLLWLWQCCFSEKASMFCRKHKGLLFVLVSKQGSSPAAVPSSYLRNAITSSSDSPFSPLFPGFSWGWVTWWTPLCVKDTEIPPL